MIDPPWQLTSENPSRGVEVVEMNKEQVAIKYQTLSDEAISAIPLHKIQSDGLLFMWVINCKFTTAIKMIELWGYKWRLGWVLMMIRLVGDISWVKLTSKGIIAQGNGFYLQHAKETCFVAQKGSAALIDADCMGKIDDVIMSKRKGQSQKPQEIYDVIESLVPNGFYCEIFGRLNNLRNDWVTIGNEIWLVCCEIMNASGTQVGSNFSFQALAYLLFQFTPYRTTHMELKEIVDDEYYSIQNEHVDCPFFL